MMLCGIRIFSGIVCCGLPVECDVISAAQLDPTSHTIIQDGGVLLTKGSHNALAKKGRIIRRKRFNKC